MKRNELFEQLELLLATPKPTRGMLNNICDIIMKIYSLTQNTSLLLEEENVLQRARIYLERVGYKCASQRMFESLQIAINNRDSRTICQIINDINTLYAQYGLRVTNAQYIDLLERAQSFIGECKQQRSIYDNFAKRVNDQFSKNATIGKRLTIEEKRHRLLRMIGKHNMKIFSGNDEIVDFFYDEILPRDINNWQIDLHNPKNNFRLHIYQQGYNLLTNTEKHELGEIFNTYVRYYSKSNFNLTNANDSLTKIENDVRSGIILKGNILLGHFEHNDYIRPIILLRLRRIGLYECYRRYSNEIYNEILEKEIVGVNDDELKLDQTDDQFMEYINTLSKSQQKNILERFAKVVVWGKKDLIIQPQQPQLLTEEILETNKHFARQQNLENYQKQYVFGFDQFMIPYEQHPELFRSMGIQMAIPFGNEKKERVSHHDPCSPLVEWTPLLNKFYTYIASLSHLPIRFIFDESLDVPYREPLPVDLKQIFRNQLVAILAIRFNDNRMHGEDTHPSEILYFAIFYNKTKRIDTLHMKYTNFVIYSFDCRQIDIGLLYKSKNITYDEYHIFIEYLRMKAYRHKIYRNVRFLVNEISEQYLLANQDNVELLNTKNLFNK